MWKTTFFILSFLTSVQLAWSGNPLEPIIFTKSETVNDYTTRIPFKLIDHLIVVEAELLDQKGNFIIDTGSETLILNKVHFKTFDPYYRKTKSTSGVLNSVDDPLERQLKEFVIKNLILTNKTSDVIDLSHIEMSKKMNLLGIIGFNILKDYEVFIDLHLNQITLSKIDTNGNTLDPNVYLETIADSIPFKLKNHTIVFDAYIDDIKLKFGLDTAAEYNQLNKHSGRKILKYYVPSKRMMLTGASGKQIEVLAGKLHRVKINDTTYFGPMVTILTNLSNMNEAFGTKLDGIVGYEFLRQKRTIINYKKEMLYFVDYPEMRQ